MAERRMFAKTIVGSGKFLRMPVTARLLYYDLGMEADDDGVVEAFRVMRTTGATEDDLKILCARGFVRVLNDELVTLINDWKANNTIKNDRYHPSIYADLIAQTDRRCLQNGTTLEPEWIQNGTKVEPERFQTDSKMEPEVRLGKDSKGKDSIEDVCAESSSEASPSPKSKPKKKEYAPLPPPTVDEVRAYCNEKGITNVNPEHFVQYYEAAIPAWTKANGEPVKNWKLTVVTWSQHPVYGNQKPQQTGGYVPQPDDYPF